MPRGQWRPQSPSEHRLGLGISAMAVAQPLILLGAARIGCCACPGLRLGQLGSPWGRRLLPSGLGFAAQPSMPAPPSDPRKGGTHLCSVSSPDSAYCSESRQTHGGRPPRRDGGFCLVSLHPCLPGTPAQRFLAPPYQDPLSRSLGTRGRRSSNANPRALLGR